MPVPKLSELAVLPFVGVVVGSLLAVAPWGWDSFGPFRWLMLSAFGFLAVGVGLARPLPVDRLTAVWALLLMWLGLASIFAVDRLHAWIGTPDRHFGFVTSLLCGALFMVARLASERDRLRILRAVIVAGALVGLYVALEMAGAPGFDSSFAADRLGGPFGQPAYLGAAMALVAPICLGMALDTNTERPWRIVAAAGTVGSIGALLGSQARAAWVGIALAVCLVVWRRRRSEHRLVVGGAGIAFVALVAIVTPVGGRVRSLFDSGGVTAGRVDEWQVALRALRDRPVTGYGPEGYRTVFGRHVDIEYVVDHGRAVITDRAHAGVIDVGLVGGVPAAVLYVGLVALTVVALWPLVARGSATQVGLAAGAIAYLVQQQFLFPLAEVDPLLWIVVGLGVGSAKAAQRPVSAEAAPDAGVIEGGVSERGVVVSPLVRGLMLGLAALALQAGVFDVIADRRIQSAVAMADPNLSARQADSANQLRADSIRYDFIASRLWAPVSIETSLARIDEGLRISPEDPALLGEQARRALDLAAETNEEADLERAIELLDSLTERDPNHPEHVMRLGVAYARRSERPDRIGTNQAAADVERAESAFRHAVLLAPGDAIPAQNLRLLLESKEKSDVD